MHHALAASSPRRPRDLGAITAGEIAMSILAEMTMERARSRAAVKV